MSCLGGTPDDPKPWYRYRPDGSVERILGRWCARTNPRTSRRTCASCPAFRGLRWDGQVATGIVGDQPYGLSESEHEAYTAALNEAFIEDDFLPLRAFLSSMESEVVETRTGRAVVAGIGARGMRAIGDPDALEAEARRMAAYRAAHPDYAARNRERTRERMRALRASRRSVCMDPPYARGPAEMKIEEESRPGARARRGGPYKQKEASQ